ncbi:hypothetical protein [Flavobacterium praedii]|uniref:hypothetical protein n=1 Tax=Flavobacterium praedii TaxID=3002900 RepID=UPI0024819BED|nr:hypothetical protein [Flavobacterium praedii]
MEESNIIIMEEMINDLHWLMFYCFTSGFNICLFIWINWPKNSKRKSKTEYPLFKKHIIVGETEKHLFRSEIEALIKNYIDKNDLKHNEPIERSDYMFYSRPFEIRLGLEYTIVFWAREKTKDELLTERIEFKLKK